MTTIAKKMLFVSYFAGTSKKGNEIKILTLSDGLRSATVFVDKNFVIDSEIEEGDEVNVEMEVGISNRNELDVQIKSITL